MNCEGCGAARRGHETACLYCGRCVSAFAAQIDQVTACNTQVPLSYPTRSMLESRRWDPKLTVEPRRIMR